MSPKSANLPSAGRPRSEEAHQAILQATLELLVEVGFTALTIEGVAARAGVGKATIYRRWPSKLPLVIEAFGRLPALKESDTGEVAEDLRRIVRHYLRTVNSTPLAQILPSLAGERAHNPELAKQLDPLLRERRSPLVQALERGVERGELPADTDVDLAADLIMGPIAVRFLWRGHRVDPKIVGPTVDAVLHGIRSAQKGAR